MRFLGVGLSKTGTFSLHTALTLLGFKSLHNDKVRLNDILDGSNPAPDFRRYDDVDAVLDLPAAYFFDELLAAYPDAKAILTIRDEGAWWRSVAAHMNERYPIPGPKGFRLQRRVRYNSYRVAVERFPADRSFDEFRANLRTYVYGSVHASEFLYRKKYREHNERVLRTIAPERLLVMNVTAGDGWEKLCPFVGREVPAEDFPHANRTPRGTHAAPAGKRPPR